MCLAWKEIIAEVKDVAVLGTDVWQPWLSESNVGTVACYVQKLFRQLHFGSLTTALFSLQFHN